jgi:hypothetical protein
MGLMARCWIALGFSKPAYSWLSQIRFWRGLPSHKARHTISINASEKLLFEAHFLESFKCGNILGGLKEHFAVSIKLCKGSLRVSHISANGCSR